MCVFPWMVYGQQWNYAMQNNQFEYAQSDDSRVTLGQMQAQLYQSAALNNHGALANILQYISVDTVDAYGNTPLCLSVLQGNVMAFANLKRYGADERHDCMQRIRYAPQGRSG